MSAGKALDFAIIQLVSWGKIVPAVPPLVECLNQEVGSLGTGVSEFQRLLQVCWLPESSRQVDTHLRLHSHTKFQEVPLAKVSHLLKSTGSGRCDLFIIAVTPTIFIKTLR